MKSRNDEKTQRILLLLKIDANNLFNRIKNRKSEYLEIFALQKQEHDHEAADAALLRAAQIAEQRPAGEDEPAGARGRTAVRSGSRFGGHDE